MPRFIVTTAPLLSLLLLTAIVVAEEVEVVDPSSIQLGPIVHETLPDELLVRIRRLTDTFEVVDGIGYEEAVDLYKRDHNPEENIRIFEEMARVYEQFCDGRCSSHEERMDVYRIVLLCSMFPRDQVLGLVDLQVITETEAKSIIEQYGLDPEPIKVMKQ